MEVIEVEARAQHKQNFVSSRTRKTRKNRNFTHIFRRVEDVQSVYKMLLNSSTSSSSRSLSLCSIWKCIMCKHLGEKKNVFQIQTDCSEPNKKKHSETRDYQKWNPARSCELSSLRANVSQWLRLISHELNAKDRRARMEMTLKFISSVHLRELQPNRVCTTSCASISSNNSSSCIPSSLFLNISDLSSSFGDVFFFFRRKFISLLFLLARFIRILLLHSFTSLWDRLSRSFEDRNRDISYFLVRLETSLEQLTIYIYDISTL